VPPAHLDRLIERLCPGVAVVWSGYGSGQGIPALFGRETFAALELLHGDTGGRALAGRFVGEVVPADFPLLDVDTADQYRQACQWLEQQAAREQFPPADVHGTSCR
jgi:CTP:molybdopterin cytidylyltransferase MocA